MQRAGLRPARFGFVAVTVDTPQDSSYIHPKGEGWNFPFVDVTCSTAMKTQIRPSKNGGPDVGRKYIARVKQLIAAPTFQDVQNIRSLRLHALKGDRDGQFSIRLTAQWRLIVEQGATRESLIIREVTNHYDD